MNTNNELRLLDDSQLDAVTGGSIISDAVNGAAAVARAIGGLLGDIVKPPFPVNGGISGAVKAGPAIGRGHIH